MYVEFLFKDFLKEFKKLFTFNNVDCPNQPAFYSYSDFHYRSFMLDFLSCLEPRQEEENVILLNELDEVNEVFFFTKGQCETGFEINRVQNYVLRQDRNIYIGAYNVTFNKRSKFVYRTYYKCEGYSIRRSLWKIKVMSEEHEQIVETFKKTIKKDYEVNTMTKIIEEKKRLIGKWHERADYSGILRVIYEDDHSHGEADQGDEHGEDEEEDSEEAEENNKVEKDKQAQ